ncbi:unnamed protein product [Rangifer tarandus platyrhynchus]|uniref:Uncharacterized protein n=2 Tax=Rangifer tarandus platyrhynchus TaxID=3082113 RepID=A0ABN8YW82_RANTA|nr:unnamed protein product [Rangifer tarandus platyrhynchus]CAI9693669.1 unnamed protein product [Rangifer tarandus platyrhynchus]
MCLDLPGVVSSEEQERRQPSGLHVHLLRDPLTLNALTSVGTQRCREEPGRETEVTLLAQATPLHCSQRDTWDVDPECPQEESVRGGSPTSSQERVWRTWKRTSQDREPEQKEGPRIGSETRGFQPRGRRPPRRKGCEAVGVTSNVHPLSHGLRNRQARCPLGASPSGPNASLGAQLPWT